jgi:outer membrane protein assembly factor BamD (BamD/ComL family)
MKKIYFFLLVLGGLWYAAHRCNFADVMAYSHKHADAVWAPKVEFAVGMVYYQRDDHPRAQEAFTQLLTDYPTGQYTARVLLRMSEMADDDRDWPGEKEYLDRFLTDFPEDPNRMIAVKRRELLYNK